MTNIVKFIELMKHYYSRIQVNTTKYLLSWKLRETHANIRYRVFSSMPCDVLRHVIVYCFLLTHGTVQLIRSSIVLLLICISHLVTHISAPPHRSSGYLLHVWAGVAGFPHCCPGVVRCFQHVTVWGRVCLAVFLGRGTAFGRSSSVTAPAAFGMKLCVA